MYLFFSELRCWLSYFLFLELYLKWEPSYTIDAIPISLIDLLIRLFID